MLFVLRRCLARRGHHAGLLAVTAILATTPVTSEEPLHLCYRADAAPFSYVDAAGTATGYSVELCRIVAAGISAAEPVMVAVTSEDRFDKLGRDCRLLCEATTMTLGRRARMEFSMITFLTATALLYPKVMPEKGKDRSVRVGFLRRTTTDDKWRSGDLISGGSWSFEFEKVESHDAAAQMLGDGLLDAYIADREILEVILKDSPALAEHLQIGEKSLSYEPYALAVARGDDALLVEVDKALVALFRSGDIRKVLGTHIPHRRFDPVLGDLFRIQSIPD